jgi:DNA-directed RNA polymerase subunit M/transcription elongation factor TFIIS
MFTEAERCPTCGSGKLTLQGRAVDGKPVRELVCLSCKHSWPVESSESTGRVRP